MATKSASKPAPKKAAKSKLTRQPDPEPEVTNQLCSIVLRCGDLKSAIHNRMAEGEVIPPQWVEEHNSLVIFQQCRGL